jgi:hypothetical protein
MGAAIALLPKDISRVLLHAFSPGDRDYAGGPHIIINSKKAVQIELTHPAREPPVWKVKISSPAVSVDYTLCKSAITDL